MLMSEYDYNLDIETQREEAEEIGGRKMVYRLVEEGVLKLEQGATTFNISVEELKREMVENGYLLS